MKTLGGWILGVFAVGVLAGNYVSGRTEPQVEANELRNDLVVPTHTAVAPVVAAPVVAENEPARSAEPVPTVAPTTTTPSVESTEEDDGSRTWKESAVVIGGAAGTGAGIGAIANGKKGAVVGGAIGAAAGTAYELIKRDSKK
jgi:hypothetical protein